MSTTKKNEEFTRFLELLEQPHGKAEALPFSSNVCRAVFERERDMIFHSSWVFVCSEKELPAAGDYFAFFLAEEPVMILRGNDGKLRALGNICRHRGTLLNEEGFGNSARLVCPYHAWAFSLEGACVAAPYTRNDEIDHTCHSLPQFSLKIWKELVFINLSEEPEPFGAMFQGLEKYFSLFEASRFSETVGEVDSTTWRANWKLVLENAMESYHLFKVHAETLERVTPTRDAYYLESDKHWTTTGGRVLESDTSFFSWLSGNSEDIYHHYFLILLPPTFVGILTWESFDWISVLPKNERECIVRGAGRREPGYSPGPDETAFVQAFLKEDKEICERIQLGMNARHSRGGRLTSMERVIVDFHHYLASRLSGRVPNEPYQSPKLAEIFGI